MVTAKNCARLLAKTLFARLTVWVLLGTLFIIFDAGASEAAPQASSCSLTESIAEFARDGDLIFRRGHSYESGMVTQLDRLGYSHVGLVRVTPGGPVVIHSAPRDSDGFGGYVEQLPLSAFLASAQAEAAALYRVDTIHPDAAAGALDWAFGHVLRETRFDYSFDTTNPYSLYCTELVWSAFRAAGQDLLPDYVPRQSSIHDRRFAILESFWSGKADFDFILPSDLADSPYVRRIAGAERSALTECSEQTGERYVRTRLEDRTPQPMTDESEFRRRAENALDFPAASGSGGPWFLQNPRFPGAIADVDFIDEQIGMAVNRRGTILYTEDGGLSWSDRTGNLASFSSTSTYIEWAGVSLIDADTATIIGRVLGDGSPQHLIARTEDGGGFWHLQHEFNSSEGLLSAVSFADANSGIVVGFTGPAKSAVMEALVLRTTDGGATWDETFPLSGAASPTLDRVMHIDADNVVAVGNLHDFNAGEFSGAILISTDGGLTWEYQIFDDLYLSDIEFANSDVGWAVGLRIADPTILKTVDGGKTWNVQEANLVTYPRAISCADAMECIIVGDNIGEGAIFKTLDGGESWTPIYNAFSAGEPVNSFFTLSHLDAETVLAAGYSATHEYSPHFLRSVDGGDNWGHVEFDQFREETGGLYSSSFSDVALLSANVGIAVGGRGQPTLTCSSPDSRFAGVIFRTADSGTTWRSVMPNPGPGQPGLHGLAFSDPEAGVAFGCEGAMLKTSDGGNTWGPRQSGTTKPLWGGYFIDSDRGVVVGGESDVLSGNWGPVILSTTDGGDSWHSSPIPEDYDGCCFNAVSFTDADTGFAAGFSAGVIRILKTVDGGKTWSTQEIGSCSDGSCEVKAMHFLDSQTGIILAWNQSQSSGAMILKTYDGGETWHDVTPDFVADDEYVALRDVDFADDLNGVVIGYQANRPFVLRTADGGETWSIDVMEAGAGSERNFGVALSDAYTGIIVGKPGTATIVNTAMIRRTVGGPTFLPLGLRPRDASMCMPEGEAEETTIVVGLSSTGGYTGTVNLFAPDMPGGVGSALSPDPILAPGTAKWTLSLNPGMAGGRHIITLIATDGDQQHPADFHLNVIDPEQGPVLIAPADSATDVDLLPTLDWSNEVRLDGYRVQVATDVAFGDLVVDEEVLGGTAFALPEELDDFTEYFWRVRGVHDCGDAAWSEVFSFTTMALPSGELSQQTLAFQLEAGDSDSTTFEIANTGSGDFVWNIEAALPPAAGPEHVEQKQYFGPGMTAGTGNVVGIAPTRDHIGPALLNAGELAAPVGLANLQGSSLPGLRPASQPGGFVDCENEPGIIIQDDGTIEDGYQSASGLPGKFMLVDRFTPRVYPISFRAVCIALLSLEASELNFEIVVFADDGENSGPGTELGALSVSAKDLSVVETPLPPDLEPIWFSFNLTSLDLTIESGSVYIGVRMNTGSVFLAVDESPDRPPGFAGGYAWDPLNRWRPMQAVFTNYRSLFVRAVEGPVTGCSDPSDIAWLSVAPGSGSTPAGESTPVEVTVDASGLDAGVYTSNLCISTNDHRPGYSLVVVPVTLTVEGSGSGELLFRDRFEVGGE